MKVYVTSSNHLKDWTNEFFVEESVAVDSAEGLCALGWEAQVHQLTFHGTAAGVVGMLNGSHMNPHNFCEIEGLVGLREILKIKPPQRGECPGIVPPDSDHTLK